MAAKFPNPPLTPEEQQKLLELPGHDRSIWKGHFPNHSIQFLRNERTRLKTELGHKRAVEAYEVKTEAQRTRMQLKSVTAELHRVQKVLDAQVHFDSVDPAPIAIRPRTTKREVVPIIAFSDWHCEERVTPESVNGKNEYNLEIFDQRADACFTNAARLINKLSRVSKVVVWLGGDFISGNIHRDVSEVCALGPMDAMLTVTSKLQGGLIYLRENLPEVPIEVVCSIGNHERITVKPRIQTAFEHSMAYFAYQSLAQHLGTYEYVSVYCPKSYHAYAHVFDKTVRFSHGDAIRYSGGQGGITVPLNKRIGRLNSSIRADLDVLGHFHQLFFGPNFVVNGSLIGYTPFAEKLGFEYEPPRQAMIVLDSHFGFGPRFPIYTE